MGTTLQKIEAILSECAVKPGARILDIGCSNIHTLATDDLVAFVRRYNDVYEPRALRRWAERVAAGGVMDPVVGGTNGAWLGDVLTRAGFRYHAFDIFPGYKTEYFDLNHQETPLHHRGAYDLVFNFGTTEHLLGQLNAFKVIHEVTATGGIIIHDLPMTGYLDHGYFCYNPMLFQHLAQANDYEFQALNFAGGLSGESVAKNLVPRYQDTPFLRTRAHHGQWLASELPTSSVYVMFRKVKDAPFRMGLETSTTVGEVPTEIGSQYGADKGDAASNHERIDYESLQRRVRSPELTLDELMAAYHRHLAVSPHQPFPKTLELRALELAIKADPSNQEMVDRLPKVRDELKSSYPLLKGLGFAPATTALDLKFDGVEAQIDAATASFDTLIAAYRQYDDKLSIELFPARLEAEALLELGRRFPEDKDILIRLGALMAKLTPEIEIQRLPQPMTAG